MKTLVADSATASTRAASLGIWIQMMELLRRVDGGDAEAHTRRVCSPCRAACDRRKYCSEIAEIAYKLFAYTFKPTITYNTHTPHQSWASLLQVLKAAGALG